MFNLLVKPLLPFILFLSLSACSVNEIYDTAINYERSSANLELKKIKLDFGEITYLDNNQVTNTTIILLHGFGGDKDNWNRFSAGLGEQHHIIVLDLPGHGETVSTKNLDYSITHQVKMLDLFLAAKNIKKTHIAGNSMGGAIALAYTEHFPNKVKSLILIDALGMIKTKSEFAKSIEKQKFNPFFDICTEEKFENLINFGMHKPPYIPGIFMGKLVSEKCARAELEKIIYSDMMKTSDLSDIARKIKTPTLIIWGRKDRVLHVDNASLFQKTIKGSKLFVLDGFGHVPLLEAPEKTAKIVETFIKSIH